MPNAPVITGRSMMLGDRRALIADDDPLFRRLLTAHLEQCNLTVQCAANGAEAWETLSQPDAPRLLILDWLMPQIDGAELCRRLRLTESSQPPYVLLVSARGNKEDVIAGLEAGADDYLTKPYDPRELHARVRIGLRILHLREQLAARIKALEDARRTVDELQCLLPICSYCKRVRNDQDYWEQVEDFMQRQQRLEFTHGVCPTCYDEVARPQMEAIRRRRLGEE